MRKHYPLNSQGDEDAGKLPWTDGVPSTGVEGSYPGQALFTDAEAEILSMIDLAGLTRNGSDLTQTMQAASRGIWLGVFGGTSGALTATLPNNVVIPSLQAGMRVRGIAASDFTGTGGTLKITGIGTAIGVMSCPLVGSDGVTALASGAWKAGQFLTFDIDASGNARFGGVGSGGFIAGPRASAVFRTAGTFTWTCPPGVTAVLAKVWGGGGGGGGAGGSNSVACGGSGGGAEEAVLTVVPGTTYSGMVGAGGSAGANASASSATPNNGGNGGTSSFLTISATGGQGGGGSYTGFQGISYAPGTGSGGNLSATGQRGMTGFIPTSGGSTATLGGAGGSAAGGGGGGGSASSGMATQGYGPGGGGGGGGSTYPGGAGADGQVSLYW